MFDRDMQNALIADGEKMTQLTGEDHGPSFPDLGAEFLVALKNYTRAEHNHLNWPSDLRCRLDYLDAENALDAAVFAFEFGATMSANSILRAALSALAKIEADEIDDADTICTEVRRLAREAMASSDQVESSLSDDAVKYRLALERIQDQYCIKHHSPWCRLLAEETLAK